MLKYAIIFAVISLIAGALGFGGVAALAGPASLAATPGPVKSIAAAAKAASRTRACLMRRAVA